MLRLPGRWGRGWNWSVARLGEMSHERTSILFFIQFAMGNHSVLYSKWGLGLKSTQVRTLA